MTVGVNDRQDIHVADDVTTTFPWTFPVSAASEVKVYEIVDGVPSELTTGFSKNPTGGSYPCPGGNVVFSVAPASGRDIWIFGQTPDTQTQTISQNSTLYSAGVESALDKIWKRIQEVVRDLGRKIGVDDPNGIFSIPSPESGTGYLYSDGTEYSLDSSVDAGDLTLTNQGSGRIGYGGAADEIKFDADLEFDESLNTIKVGGLTASRAVVTDANKKLASSAVTATELGHLSGVTSPVQTQIDAKLATAATTYVKVLNRTTVPVSSAGTVETTLYTYTIPGNTQGTDRKLRFTGNLAYSTDASPADLTHFRIYLGATAYDIADWSLQNNAAAYPFRVTVEISPYNNATNAQRIYIFISFYDSGDQTKTRRNVAAIDMTADAIFKITAEWSSTDADDYITLENATMELI